MKREAKNIPLLSTKLSVPPRIEDIVIRRRLLKFLDQGLFPNRRLSVISAPAGYGKTTLVSEWVRSLNMPVAWLSLDAADNDPARFISYFIRSLESVYPEIDREMGDGIQFGNPQALESLLVPIINRLAELEKDIVIVLDDYHLITLPQLHHLVGFMIEHAPPNFCLLLATRSDPPLPLGRLRGRGQLLELRASNLCFSYSEAKEFLNDTAGLNLSVDQMSSLVKRTEGWVAGLQLAALSLRGRKDTGRFIEAFRGTHKFIADYLTDEVLNLQSEEKRTFMLQTSILSQLSGPLCDRVTGRADSKEMLEQLQEANLFLIPLDDERTW